MKTPVEMQRRMGQFVVIQRTSDGMFNATELIRQFNRFNNTGKRIKDFIKISQTNEFIDELKKDLESQREYYPDGDYQPIRIIKGRNTKSGKTPDMVWYHPYLFIKFAMWLNPRFELQVIKFIYDQLIEFRNNAGDGYVGLTNAVSRFNNVDYRQMAKGLNWIVFGKHERGIRQKATQEQLKDLVDLQSKLAFTVDMGYIKSFDELLNEMRRIYNLKWTKYI